MNTRDLKSALRIIGPFIGAATLAWVAVLVESRVVWSQWSASALLALSAGALALFTAPRQRWSRLGIVPSALVFLTAVGLLRNSVGAVSSGAGVLAVIPVFHTALYSRSRRDLAIVLAGVGALYLLPLLIVGSPAYPHSQYRAALLSVTVYGIIGYATQGLVDNVRSQAQDARRREQMLEHLSEVAHRLFESPNVRGDVCQAATTISDATSAALYERRPGCSELVCTATSPADGDLIGLTAAPNSAVGRAFLTGRTVHVSGDVASQIGNRTVWETAGRPAVLLYQPLTYNGVTLGVLSVGWPPETTGLDSRATVAGLLAHEAAAVIARADAMENLAGEAQTDPLTGLPNRRAWDLALRTAIAADIPIAVAMFDLDHFKDFNDANGHPAGDRLLKETSAAWRDQLRAGDVLARLGGEEFGLLLHGCDEFTAREVTERLRRRVSHDRTCSAGIAMAASGDTAESLVARADRALYDAKASGRDRTCFSTVV